MTFDRLRAGFFRRHLTTACLLFAGMAQQAVSDVAVLVEAEAFDARGGWQVDSQFVEQMGSPYVIAHGMGAPVADGSTVVAIPEAGDYSVWVRTRNWVPAFSNGAAPGRFNIAVNGVDLPAAFGAEGGVWHWQSGGTVTMTSPSATLVLKDLTGFDGRCDAIALIKGSVLPPPDGGPELAAWRRLVLGEPASPEDVRTFDCVVVGGGQAGCAAALAAGRSGIRVAFVQDRPVLGGNSSGEIRVCPEGEARHPIVGEIRWTGGNRAQAAVAMDAQREALIAAETNITLFMPWRAYGAGTNPAGRVAYVDARHTHSGARVRLQAPLFVDCTGDAWVGYWTGADFRVGREGRNEFNESRAPAQPDAMTMGNSLMWKTRNAAGPSTFPAVPWAMAVAGTRADTGGDWNWEYGMHLDTIADAEQIRDHLLRAIYGNFYNAKQKTVNTNLVLDWVPFVAGKRESRRILGDHILIQGDVESGAYFEDAIGTATWGIDLHDPTSVSYLSSYTSTAVAKWYMPFRCLYSRNVPNLMMAGRCISVSHVGLGSPRVQNTTAQMGVAVGYAAAMCKEYGIEPRDIYRNEERTVELQARITGTWPPRPYPGTLIVDNADKAPTSMVIGAWTTSSSVSGYHGANYLHDGNTGKGTKRVIFTPKLEIPGRYDIAMRWVADDNRASNVPVWIFGSPQVARITAAGAPHIRSAAPNDVSTSDEMAVGRYAPGDYTRGVLHFDLAAIPTSAVVVSAEFQLCIVDRDTNSVAGYVGTNGLCLHRLSESFDPSAVTWNQRSSGVAWTTAGGTFDSNTLSVIPAPTDPNLVSAGQLFAFPITAGLGTAVNEALRGAGLFDLIVRTPGIESSYNARKLYRFGSAAQESDALRPALIVKYFDLQASHTYIVNQRVDGGRWNRLGSHDFAGGEVSVVIANDGANGYVIADAIEIVNTNAVLNDYDGDGLPDWWERYHFLSETGANPADDPDGDGRNNLIECRTGTNPHDAASRFDMRNLLSRDPGEFTLSWPSASNRLYTIEMAEVLPYFMPLIEHIPATPPENEHIVPAGEDRRYYRIVLEE